MQYCAFIIYLLFRPAVRKAALNIQIIVAPLEWFEHRTIFVVSPWKLPSLKSLYYMYIYTHMHKRSRVGFSDFYWFCCKLQPTGYPHSLLMLKKKKKIKKPFLIYYWICLRMANMTVQCGWLHEKASIYIYKKHKITSNF